ncbi:MAG: toll/interleukin-1 receptor domain-containing protein [Planctomycetes bacterium]|nr:toll/interleukin-1 receptor domain-containing protein [Planctomycetota bacterium]
MTGSKPPRTKRKPTPGADVFVSYSSADKVRAEDVGRVIESTGWSVWMDRWSLLGGQRFEPAIRHALQHARCVLVLWSQAAAGSRWVRPEGEDGLARKVLVPATLDGLATPWGDQLHHVDLSDWDGSDPEDGSTRALLVAIANVLGEEARQPDVRKLRAHRRRRASMLLRTVSAFALVIALVAWVAMSLDLPEVWAVLAAAATMAAGLYLPALKGLGVLRLLLDWSTSLRAIVVKSVVLAVCLNFGPITVERRESALPSMSVEVVAADGGAHLRGGAIDREDPRWHRLLFAPIWGRRVQVEVGGYAPKPVTAGAFRDPIVMVPDDVKSRPVLVLRIHHRRVMSAAGAMVRVKDGGGTIAVATLNPTAGSLVIGADPLTGDALDERTAAWREELSRAGLTPTAIDAVVMQWRVSQSVNWSKTPALDAPLEVEVQWAGGMVTAPQHITLSGALSDVEATQN